MKALQREINSLSLSPQRSTKISLSTSRNSSCSFNLYSPPSSVSSKCADFLFVQSCSSERIRTPLEKAQSSCLTFKFNLVRTVSAPIQYTCNLFLDERHGAQLQVQNRVLDQGISSYVTSMTPSKTSLESSHSTHQST